ncbi:hypothetical protein [Agromyces bauzanensis]
MAKQFSVELEDPTTGELSRVEADSQEELDRLIDEHLARAYPTGSDE